MWHVSSRSGVATLRTAIHLLLTYLLTYPTRDEHRSKFCAALRLVIVSLCIDYPFSEPRLHLATPQGAMPVEFRGDLWRQKTRVTGLSCGVVCVILRLAVLVELRLVTDRQTRTPAHG